MVGRFEDALAKYVGANDCVAVSSGTAALHLAYSALGLGPGDELITTPISFSATANAARLLGAEIVFADVDPTTGNICPDSVSQRITERTRGISAVHFGGLPADLPGLARLAAQHNLWLVEDASHALGGELAEHRIGSCNLSDAAIFSTHAIKNITTGEGGAITTRRADVAKLCRLRRSHGIDKQAGNPGQPWSYDMVDLGWNYRLTDIQAALGLSQLERIDALMETREALAEHYEHELKIRLGSLVLPPPRPPGRRSGRHLFAAQVDFEAAGVPRAELMKRLRGQGIGCQVHYIPIHTLTYYRQRYGVQTLTKAEAFYSRQLSLPFHVGMNRADVTRVVQTLEQNLGTARKDDGARIQTA